MRPRTTITTVLIVAALAAASARPSAQRATVERHVLVRVTDARNQPVSNLTPADFVIREDGVAREILGVAPAPPPTHVALLVDDTAGVQPFLTNLRAALTKFAFGLTALPSPPSISIVTYAERPTTVLPFTSSDAAIEQAIRRIIPRPAGGAYLFDAIAESAQTLRTLKAERPAIVAFVMDASPVFSNQRHTQVADALRDAHASLWTVQLQRTGTDNDVPEQERARVVSDVTGWSGGFNVPILSGQALESAFANLASVMLARYDVTYGRPESLIPPERLSVEIRNTALRLSAPRWPSP